MRKSFRRSITIGFTAMVLLCIIVGFLAFAIGVNLQKVFRDTIRENVSALKAAEELELALVGQKGFMSNYFLSDDPVWLDRLEDKRADFFNWLQKASDVALTAPEKSIIQDIKTLYGAYERDRSRAKELYESGNIQKAKNILLEDMWNSLDTLYQRCEDFLRVNESLIEKSGRSFQKKIALTMIIIFVISTLIIGLAGALFFWLARNVLRSIENISATTRAVSLKSLTARVNTANLEEEMVRLAQSFNMMLERLEKSFEYVKEFSSSIGHELKTPLAIIKGESQIALRKERQAEEYKKAFGVTIDETNRMIQIVEDLAFLTRLDYNPENIEKEEFDFIPFFKDIYKRLETLVSQKGLALSIEMPASPIMLEGNKLHLSRLFFNLIQNAIKFTPSSGKISLIVKPQGGLLDISVSDTGVGIREEDLPRVFRRFFHKGNPQSEANHSIGLGLSVAESIAKFHAGSIEVKSSFGKGATFTVSLPIRQS